MKELKAQAGKLAEIEGDLIELWQKYRVTDPEEIERMLARAWERYEKAKNESTVKRPAGA